MLLSIAVGCGGGAAGGAMAKDGPHDETVSDPIAAAEADLAAAESRVARVVGGGGQGLPGQQPVKPTAPAQPEPPGPRPQPAPQPHRVETEASAADDDTCESACDALHAMQRAADRVCELAPGDRCEAARTRVADAEKRVMEACPECDA